MPGPDYETMRQAAQDAFERDFLVRALTEHKGNLLAIWRAYNIHRVNLWRMMRRHGLTREQFLDQEQSSAKP